MDVNANYSNILKFIYNLRDGETVDLMKKRGASYNASYGLSTLHIKNEASRIGKCQELALKLWAQDTRETKIFALHLLEPEKCDEKFLNSIVLELPNVEIAQQAAMTVLYEAEILPETLVEWCKCSSISVKMAGYHTLIRKIKAGTFAASAFGILFVLIHHELNNDPELVLREIASLLEAMARSDEKKEAVVEFVNKEVAHNTKYAYYLVENVLKQLSI